MSNEEKIICEECGKEFNAALPASHLHKVHEINMKQYREKYPNAKVVLSTHGIKSKFARTDLFKKKSIPKIEPEKDNILADEEIFPFINQETILENLERSKPITIEKEKTPIVKDIDFSKLNELTNKGKSPFNNSKGLVPQEKVYILDYLINTFDEKVEDSYYIEKVSLSGFLDYRIISDIAIPSKKIDLEFPKSFWHNYDYMPQDLRDSTLKRDGWTIITIDCETPTASLVDLVLKEMNII